MAVTLVVWLVADCVARPYPPTQNYKRVVTLQISTNTAINYTTGYSQLFIKIMTEQEKIIAKVFDKSVEALGIMTKSLCDAIKSTKSEKRYVMYKEQKCELLGTTDGGMTLNTGGLAFCIILPDGSVENIQDSHCTFL